MAEVGVVPVGDPVEAFAELVSEVVALKNHFANKVAQLEETDGIRYESSYRTEQIRSEVGVYERFIDRAGRLLGLWISLGLEARRVELTEAHGQVLDGVIRKLLEGVFTGLLAAGVRADVIEAFQREQLPAIVRSAVRTVAYQEQRDPAPAVPVDSTPAPAPAPTTTADDDDMAWSRFDDEPPPQ